MGSSYDNMIPFINWGKKKYDGIDVECGALMGDKHMAVSWCDGDNLQFDTIVSEEGIQVLCQQHHSKQA